MSPTAKRHRLTYPGLSRYGNTLFRHQTRDLLLGERNTSITLFTPPPPPPPPTLKGCTSDTGVSQHKVRISGLSQVIIPIIPIATKRKDSQQIRHGKSWPLRYPSRRGADKFRPARAGGRCDLS